MPLARQAFGGNLPVLPTCGWGLREVFRPKLNMPSVPQREALYLWSKYSICCTPSRARNMLFCTDFPMPKRILIVEDEVSVRNAVRSFFEHQSGLEVCGEAANGLEGLEKATELRPDLVLLDLSMPIMNGVEVASLLRSRMPNTPVVLYTMFDDVLGKPLAATLGIAAIGYRKFEVVM